MTKPCEELFFPLSLSLPSPTPPATHPHTHLTLQALARSVSNGLRAKARSHLTQELLRLLVPDPLAGAATASSDAAIYTDNMSNYTQGKSKS